MILSDEEIIAAGYKSGDPDGLLQFGKNIEAAILAKLASAELPEPTYWIWRTDSDFHFWEECVAKKWFDAHSGDKQITYTADQLTAWGNTRYAQGAAAQLAEKPSGYLSQYNLEMLQQGYPQTIVMLEGAKRDVPLYTRRQA